MTKVSTWTEDQDNALKAAWATGASAAVIARQLTALFGREVTKNSIVGRAHRLKLASRASPIKPSTGAKPRRLPVWSGNLPPSSPRPPVATTRPRHPMAAPTAGAGATPSAVFREPPERAGLPPGLGAGASLSTRPAPVFVAPAPLPGGNERGCRWPMWGDERPTHLYCGEARRDLACPYCPTHAARAFQRVAPTGSLAAWNPAQRQFRRTDGQGNLTAGTRFYA